MKKCAPEAQEGAMAIQVSLILLRKSDEKLCPGGPERGHVYSVFPHFTKEK